MQTLTVPILAEGVLVEIAVGIAYPAARAHRQAGKPVPPQVTVLALIDTGAEATAVDPVALAPLISLAIQPLRFVFVNFSGPGAKPAAEYSVSLAIGMLSAGKQPILTVRSHPVIAQDLATLGYQAILGRDLLARCLLVYDGPGNTVTLGG